MLDRQTVETLNKQAKYLSARKATTILISLQYEQQYKKVLIIVPK